MITVPLIKKEKKFAYVMFCVFLLNIVLQSIPSSATSSNQTEISDSGYDTALRGIEPVTIEVPDIVIWCCSNVEVNVTVKNNLQRPCIIAISVFLKTEGEDTTNQLFLIGFKRITLLRPLEEKKISIMCHTPKLFRYAHFIKGPWIDVPESEGRRVLILPLLNTIKPIKEKMFEKGSIGVQVVRGPRLLSHILVRKAGNIIFKNNMFVVWKPVLLIHPYVIKNPFDPDEVKIPEETNADGTFNITARLQNDLPVNVSFFIAVFVQSGSQIFVGTIPKIWSPYFEIGYIAGTLKGNISKYSTSDVTINCQFPKENFAQGNYDIRTFFYVYIPTKGNVNLFGKSFYDKVLILSTEYTRRMLPTEYWEEYLNYFTNVPLFREGVGRWSKTFAPYIVGKIYLNTQSPTEKNIEDLINRSIERIKDQTPYYFLLVISVVIFAAVLYALIRKVIH